MSEESGEWQEGEGLASEEEVGSRVLTSAQFPLLPKGGKDHIDVSLFLLLKMSTGPFVTCYPLWDPIYMAGEHLQVASSGSQRNSKIALLRL